MTTIPVATWNPGPVAAGQLQVSVARSLVAEARTALSGRGVADESWFGNAADAAAQRHADLLARVDALGEVLAVLEPALARAADRLAVLVDTVRLAELMAVLDTVGPADADGGGSAAATATATATALELDADLAVGLVEIAALLTRQPTTVGGPAGALRQTLVVGTSSLVGTPSTHTAPVPVGDVVTWWGSLVPSDRDAVIAQRPEIVGPADGLPGWARDRANRILLDRADTALVAEVATLEPRARTWRDLVDGAGGLDGAVTVGTFGGGTRRLAYQQAVAKLAAVRATRQVLDQRDGRTRQLLAVDVTGRTARLAVAVGDVDRAAHVAVVVPGFTTTVERDLGGADRVSTDLADQARRAATLVGDHRDVAVVSWLGYDIPQTADTLRSGHSVVLRASAEAGAAGLATFLRGLPSDRHVTVVGHSYGSTTAGLAVARGDTGVDDLVVLGSPGLGADSSTGLGLPPRHVHVLEADDDPVADLGWFGRDPGGLPGVDRLSTDDVELPDGRTGRRSVGHSAYLVPGTTSQWNVAAVVAGAPVVREGRPPPSW